MGNYDYLLIISIILLSTKFFGLVSQKVHMPQVVGALIAGLILGPSVLDVVPQTDFIVKVAEIGVILLMFLAGLDTNLDELKKTGVASTVVATFGVIVPLIGGFLTHKLFFSSMGTADFMESLFTGIVLTATSVSITVETLRELGKLNGKIGTIILGAAIIDDIIGIIILTLVMSFKDPTVKIPLVIAKMTWFFILLIIMFFIFKIFTKKVDDYDNLRRTAIYGFAFCLLLSYLAEAVFGVADITGAYFAGIILCNSGVKKYIAKKITISSYMFFSPIFFASVGINTSLNGLTSNLMLFALILVIVATLTKVIGCYLGARLCRIPHHQSLVCGVGMIARSEVALIMAEKGAAAGILSAELFPAIILVVIVTTLITPILLKLSLRKAPDDE